MILLAMAAGYALRALTSSPGSTSAARDTLDSRDVANGVAAPVCDAHHPTLAPPPDVARHPRAEAAGAQADEGHASAGRLRAVTLDVELLCDGAETIAGYLYATRSPSTRAAWADAVAMKHGTGAGRLRLPGPGRYDVLAVCYMPLGWRIESGVEVGDAGGRIAIQLGKAERLTARFASQIPPLPDGAPATTYTLLEPLEDRIPKELLYPACARGVFWRGSESVDPRPAPSLLRGCRWRCSISDEDMPAVMRFSGDWEAAPSVVEAGTVLGAHFVGTGTLILDLPEELDVDEPQVRDLTVRVTTLDGATWATAVDPVPLPFARHDKVGMFHHGLRLRPDRYQVDIELERLAAFRGTVLVVRDRPTHVQLEPLPVAGPVETLPGPRVRIALAPARDALRSDEPIVLHGWRVDASQEGGGRCVLMEWPEGQSVEELELDAAWADATWICAAQSGRMSTWTTPLADELVTLRLEAAGYVAVVARQPGLLLDGSPLVTRIRREDGRPFLSAGVAEGVLHDPESGALIGPLPPGTTRFVLELRGGATRVQAVEVRAEQTAILWID